MNQSNLPLLNAMQASASRQSAPFYAPGHKRGKGTPQPLKELLGNQVFQADLPELPELDNLFAPQGVISQAQQLAAEAFGAEETWFLVNGSTAGIMAAILATCDAGDKIIVPRNVHRSVISGLILSGAMPIFIYPESDPAWDLAGSITPEAVETALKQHPDAKAVMVVYPTYHGVCGDLTSIAEIVHRHHLPLLVDEAHGAHFAFHPHFPISALAAGADLTVQSTHKVLGAMTQASMLHCQGNRIDRHRLSQSLQLLQSTSPSYLLLASLDAARQQMAFQGKALLEQTLQLAEHAKTQLKKIPHLKILEPATFATPGFFALDPTRLTVCVANLGMTGYEADEILHTQLGVTAELPTLRQLTFILSIGNTHQDINQLIQSFLKLSPSPHLPISPSPNLPISPATISPREAFFAPAEMVPLEQAGDRISTEIVCPYPPGVPVLVPGEIVTTAALNYLQQVLQAGGTITGCSDPDCKTLKVVKNG
jgi:arginine decarboxylase